MLGTLWHVYYDNDVEKMLFVLTKKLRAAAVMSGVTPFTEAAFGSAPLSSKTRTQLVWPLAAARDRAVRPCSSLRCTPPQPILVASQPSGDPRAQASEDSQRKHLNLAFDRSVTHAGILSHALIFKFRALQKIPSSMNLRSSTSSPRHAASCSGSAGFSGVDMQASA